MSPRFLTTVIVMSLLAACASATAAPVPTPSPIITQEIPSVVPTVTAPAAATIVPDQMVDVGGYKLRIVCTGEGSPTVVAEHGPGDQALESGRWTTVRYAVEKRTRICIYDRAGLGSSEVPPSRPRTSQDMVNDLHTLLVKAGAPGPYVLVGHDFGAFNVRLYASQYPEEVAGMVLADPLHPDYESATLAALPPESPGEPAALGYMRQGLWPDPTSGEGIDMAASAEQVRATGSLGDLPLVVLTRTTRWFFGLPETPTEVLAKMEEVWAALQADLAKLSSNSTHVIAIPGGQGTAVDEDQLVVDAILKVVELSR